MDVGLSELPDGWVWATVKEIAEFIRGVSYKKNESSKIQKEDSVPILRANNINRQLNYADLVYIPRERIKDEQFIKAFDIIIAMSSGSKNLVGKAAQSHQDYHGGFGTFCGLVRVSSQLDRKFIGLFFQSLGYRNKISRLSSGMNINNLRRQHIESMCLPIPPLSEQHRIVAKIEELFTKLDAGINELRKAQSQLKRYRQSVLKAAFEGKLTETWRAEHQDEIEPAAPIASDLPNGWEWTTLEEVSKLNPRIDKQSIDDDLEVTFLPMKNVEELSGKIDLSETKRFSELKRKSYTPFRDGDILFAKVTPCMENGKITIAYDLKNGIGFGSTEFHVIRLSEEHSKQFFFFYVLQQKFRQEAKRAMTGAVGLLRVPTDYMRKVPIPLPPLSEQQAIVSEVESRLSVTDEVEKTVTAELKRAEQLRQSILKTAFSGKLVPQDPNDEPASVLLERIKAGK